MELKKSDPSNEEYGGREKWRSEGRESSPDPLKSISCEIFGGGNECEAK